MVVWLIYSSNPTLFIIFNCDMYFLRSLHAIFQHRKHEGDMCRNVNEDSICFVQFNWVLILSSSSLSWSADMKWSRATILSENVQIEGRLISKEASRWHAIQIHFHCSTHGRLTILRRTARDNLQNLMCPQLVLKFDILHLCLKHANPTTFVQCFQ